MKPYWTGLFFCSVLVLAASAQTDAPNNPAWNGWHVTAMDDCSTTREYTNFVINSTTGETTPEVHRIIEVATGLNFFYKESSQWQTSQDLIESTPDGGAVANHGPHKLYFKPTLSSGYTIVTKDDHVITTRPIGIYYYDPATDQSVELAKLNESAVGKLQAPNQILWRSAFNSDAVKADLRMTYTRYGFECDVIYTHAPKPPESFAPALNPETAQLQVRHEWSNCPGPIIINPTVLNDGRIDEMAVFDNILFPLGKAFLTNLSAKANNNESVQIDLARSDDLTNTTLVCKKWHRINSSLYTLTESVPWNNVKYALNELPKQSANIGASNSDIYGLNNQNYAYLNMNNVFDHSSILNDNIIYKGYIIDYVLVVGSGDYTFYGTNTYYVNGHHIINGTVTFEKGSCIKFGHEKYLQLCGPILSGQGSLPLQTILTSCDEDIYGERIVGSSGNPGYEADYCIWLNYSNGSRTLDNMLIRYAHTAVNLTGNQSVTLRNTTLQFCDVGVQLEANCNLTIDEATCDKCMLNYDTIGGNVTGSIYDSYPTGADYDDDNIPDWWEMKHFGHCCYNGSQDADGDGLTNYQEWQNNSSPWLPYPTIVSWPTYQIVPAGANVTLSSSANPGYLSYSWTCNTDANFSRTTASFTLNNVQYANSGLYTITISPPAPIISGFPYPPNLSHSYSARLLVLSQASYNTWQNYIDTTNSKSDILWQTCVETEPKYRANWNSNCVLYNRAGFTAISQHNNFIKDAPGQIPFTALTRRHAYTKGHDFDAEYHDSWYTEGKTITFYTASNDPIEVRIRSGYTRHHDQYGNGYDYTIVVLDQDLPLSITPMMVGTRMAPHNIPVEFRICQCGRLNANSPPFWPTEPTRPVFNELWWEAGHGGDSGCPYMTIDSSGALIFMDAAGPCDGPSIDPMQTDMNTLSTRFGLNPYLYQMCWVN